MGNFQGQINFAPTFNIILFIQIDIPFKKLNYINTSKWISNHQNVGDSKSFHTLLIYVNINIIYTFEIYLYIRIRTI